MTSSINHLFEVLYEKHSVTIVCYNRAQATNIAQALRKKQRRLNDLVGKTASIIMTYSEEAQEATFEYGPITPPLTYQIIREGK